MARPTRKILAAEDPDLLFADGFDRAILGVVQRTGEEAFVLYDGRRCIRILMDRDGMDRDGAEEHFAYNVAGAWVGERTPGFLWRGPQDDEEETDDESADDEDEDE